MASKVHQFSLQTFKTSKPFHNCKQTTTISLAFLFTTQQQQHSHLSISYQNVTRTRPQTRISISVPRCSKLSSSPKPPTTREEAILQAKTSLASTLEKPLNNTRLAGKIKKIKQPRFRVEIPVIDDSPSSLSELALEVFGEMPMRKKGSEIIRVLIFWPSRSLTHAAVTAFDAQHSSYILVQNMDMSSVVEEDIRTLSSPDVAVFLGPDASQLAFMKTVTDSLYPRPVVMFNPGWGFEEEANLGEMSGFVGSFEVIYSFTGLEVRGILSKRKGVIFRCVKDGVVSGEKWYVFVEEEGELKVASRFTTRPSISEVELVLYNLMAVNSPVTKSAKFLKDLVSSVTGKK